MASLDRVTTPTDWSGAIGWSLSDVEAQGWTLGIDGNGWTVADPTGL